MGNLKIVVVIMTAVKGFVKGIVGYTVKCLTVYPASSRHRQAGCKKDGRERKRPL